MRQDQYEGDFVSEGEESDYGSLDPKDELLDDSGSAQFSDDEEEEEELEEEEEEELERAPRKKGKRADKHVRPTVSTS